MYLTNSTALPAGDGLDRGAGGTFIFDPQRAFAGPASGNATASPHGIAAVPEPGTLALLAAGNVGSRARHLAEKERHFERRSPLMDTMNKLLTLAIVLFVCHQGSLRALGQKTTLPTATSAHRTPVTGSRRLRKNKRAGWGAPIVTKKTWLDLSAHRRSTARARLPAWLPVGRRNPRRAASVQGPLELS